MKTLAVALALLLSSLPSQAQVSACAIPEPSFCHPALPGLESQLPPELSSVRIDSFSYVKAKAGWRAELTLISDGVPRSIRVMAWRHDFSFDQTWLAGSEKSFSVPVGDKPWALSVEWEEGGETWHRWVGLNYGPHEETPGTYYFTAGHGSLLPWWLQ